MNRRNELLVRVYIVMTFFVLLSLLIIAKVFYVNVIEGKKWRSKISKNVKLIDIKGDRGNIYAKGELVNDGACCLFPQKYG